LLSSNDSVSSVQFGTQSQFPVQADYNADGRTDIGVFDPFTAAYYYIRSSDNATINQPFGQNGDILVASYNVF